MLESWRNKTRRRHTIIWAVFTELTELIFFYFIVNIAQWESARPNLDLPKIEARTEVSA